MIKIRLYSHIFLCFFCSISIFAQGDVWVKVMDEKSREPLPFADISGAGFNGLTDREGLVRLASGSTYEATYLGYRPKTFQLEHRPDTFRLYLSMTEFILDVAVITGNQSGERYINAVAPLDIMPASMITSRSTPGLSGVINRMPGVQIIDGQISLRGGAGYAYGAGSRVALLMNGIPMLQPDAASVPWGDLPMELIERTEIWKGSAASLYGSNALNGVIQVNTWPYLSDTSFTRVRLASRWVGPPKDEAKQWYSDARTSYWGDIIHKNLEGPFKWQGSVRFENLKNHIQGSFDDRYRAAYQAKYEWANAWEIGAQTLLNYKSDSGFLYWENATSGALMGDPASVIQNEVLRFQVDPYIKYTSARGHRHWLQTRFFLSNNSASENRSSKVRQYYMQYQYAHSCWEGDGLWISGTTGQAFESQAALFGSSDLWAYNAGIFTNYEHTFLNALKVTAGARFEYNGQFPGEITFAGDTLNGNVEEFRPLLSAGLNYEFWKASAVSFQIGQGYRFPSIAEKFITTALGQINISPNPSLVSEDGYSMNLSLKQGLALGNWNSLIRVDLFRMQFRNMIEFGIRNPNLGFQALNIGDTEIEGVEISWMGQAQWGKLNWEYLSAYTFIDPRYQEFTTDIAARSSADYNILKYRVRHQFTLQNQMNWNSWQLNVSTLYNSELEAIDKILELFVIDGLEEYRANNSSSFLRWDVSLGYNFKKWNLLLDVENITNREYSLRPGLIEMPRNYSLQISYYL